MHGVSKLKLAEVTPYLVCKLCNGYFIDPCTAQDCLHTFCKTCIVKHLYQHCTCPICGVVIHKTRPLEMIRHDQTMQDLVYKLVPGVFGKEMERRRKFYADHLDPDPNTQGNSEERGEVKEDREILAEDDCISMALVHSPNGDPKPSTMSTEEGDDRCAVTYLRCPANFTISGLKKLIRAKYDLSAEYMIDVFHSDEPLSDDYTLMDIAYIYTWKRRGPLRVFFSIYEFDPLVAEEKLSAVTADDTQKTTGSVIEISDSVTITELVKPAENTDKSSALAAGDSTAVALGKSSVETAEESNLLAAGKSDEVTAGESNVGIIAGGSSTELAGESTTDKSILKDTGKPALDNLYGVGTIESTAMATEDATKETESNSMDVNVSSRVDKTGEKTAEPMDTADTSVETAGPVGH